MTTKARLDVSCDAACPVQRTADIIEHKWTTLIVRDLLSGKKRYSELARSLSGISPKVLSERLQELEGHRLVMRTVYPTTPPTTEYELTELGRKLEVVIRAMQEFGQLLPGTDAVAQHAQPADAGSRHG
jgi:DNA-binding HxlR family transcriptional regulator